MESPDTGMKRRGGGRRRHPAWAFFDRSEEGPNNYKATCKACGHKFQGITERLVKHLRKCERINTEDLRQGFFSGSEREANENTNQREDRTSVQPVIKRMKLEHAEITQEEEGEQQQPQHSLLQEIINQQRKQWTAEELKLNLQLTRAIISSRCAFETVQDGEMRKFFSMMRSDVTLATASELSGGLLDSVYQQEVATARKKMAGNLLRECFHKYCRLKFRSMWQN